MAWGQTLGSGPGASVFGANPFTTGARQWQRTEQQRLAERQQKIDEYSRAHPTLAAALVPGMVDNPNAGGAGGTLPGANGPTPLPWTVGVKGAAHQLKPDVDISQPGDLERAYAQHGSEFFQPGAAQQFNQQYGAAMMAPDANQQLYEQQRSQGPMVNNAQSVFNSFRAPNIAKEPGYGSYYDNAEKNAVNSLNTQLGARGAYGSSVGLGQIGKSITDLRADQARTEADYGLRRTTEQRGWEDLRGNLARNADLSARSNQDIMRDIANNASTSRETGFKNAAEAARAAGLERTNNLTGGMVAAGSAQGAREGRASAGLGAIRGTFDQLQGILGDSWDKILSGDMSMVDAIQSALTAGRANDANYDSSQQGRALNEALQIVNASQSPEAKAASKAKGS